MAVLKPVIEFTSRDRRSPALTHVSRMCGQAGAQSEAELARAVVEAKLA
jgi:hypothetical protein